MSTGRRLAPLVVGLTIALAVALAPARVSAHADLLTSDPAPNSVVATAPDAVTLTFTESVDITDDAVRLVDGSGAAIELGAATQPTPESVTVDLPDDLADGTYVVAWSAVSADSHPISGAFVFSIGAESALDPTLVDELGAGDASRFLVTGLSVGRFLSFAGIAVMTGVLAMVTVLAPQRLRTRRVGNLVWFGSVSAVVGTALMISFQAAIVDGWFLDWGTIAGTRSGRWWLLRLLVVAGLSVAVGWAHLLRRRAFAIAGTACALTLYLIVALGGHAVSGRWVVPGIIATVIHLAAMSAWVGGLIVLFLVVDRDEMWATAKRFSPIAVVTVLVLAGTGIFNAWRQVAEVDGIGSTSYGRWLLAKLQLVLVVLAAAGLTRLALRNDQVTGGAKTARAASVGAARKTEPTVDHGTEVRRNVGIEIVGVVAVLAATAGLANATPPRVLSEAEQSTVATSTVTSGVYEATVTVEPAVAGPVEIVVEVTGGDAAPDEITIVAEPDTATTGTGTGIGAVEISTTETEPGRVVSNGATLPIAGVWTLVVTARFGDFDQTVFRTNITVS